MEAPKPPNYREGDPQENCGNCRMYYKGKCWGYGNVSVSKTAVCDSWTPQGTREAAKRLWAQHRRRLKEA